MRRSIGTTGKRNLPCCPFCAKVINLSIDQLHCPRCFVEWCNDKQGRVIFDTDLHHRKSAFKRERYQ
jgi:hypothetical protein